MIDRWRQALRSDLAGIWRWLLVAGWFLGLCAGVWWFRRSGIAVLDLLDLIRSAPAVLGTAPTLALFCLAALVRPFLLIPTTLLVVTAGLLFGPWLGLPVAMTGLALGATSTWAFGRWVTATRPAPRSSAPTAAHRGYWSGLGAVCAARLANLPCDAVSFSAGCLRTPYPGFLTGTLIGALPGVAVLALAGGALSGTEHLRLVLGGIAAGLLVALWAWLRTRNRR